jgi:hypothetical protein
MSDGVSWANTQATKAASSKERPRCKERSAMVYEEGLAEGNVLC